MESGPEDSKELQRRHRRAIRVRAGESQAQAAEACGLTLHLFRLVENNEPHARLGDLEKVAAHYGMSTADYVGPDCQVPAEPHR